MSSTRNKNEGDSTLLSQTKKGALGMGKKMKAQRQQQPDYILPSESEDTGIDSQGSSWTLSSVGTGNWTMATIGTNATTDSAYLETILRGDDLNYVKQKYGNLSIVMSVLQLFFLTMLLALCGFAPLTINPAIGPYPDALSLAGATNSYAILRQFQLWRLVTTPLISAGVLHFLCLVGIQLELGAFFEREWGSKSWFIIYVASAIGCALCDCAFNPNGVSVGSSGPLIGLFGAKIGEIIMQMNFKTVDSYLVDGLHQLLAMFFTVFFVSLLTFFPYVEPGGHFGGFITGFITGMILFSSRIKHRREKKVWFFSALVLGAVSLIFLLKYMITSEPNEDLAEVCEYYENMHPENYDCQCAL